MYQHIHDWLSAKNFKVVDFEDVFALTTVGATSTADVCSIRTRRPDAWIVGIGNDTNANITWTLTVDDSPLQPCPYVSFTLSLALTTLVTPLPLPLPVAQNRKVALRAVNASAGGIAVNGRFWLYYCEPKIDPIQPPTAPEPQIPIEDRAAVR